MKMHLLGPILWTKDLAAIIDFYTNVLGFTGNSNCPNFVTLIIFDERFLYTG